jgi:hypothetical protein
VGGAVAGTAAVAAGVQVARHGPTVTYTAMAGQEVAHRHRNRPAAQRRRIVARHVERAESNHRKLTTLRAKALPHRVTAPAKLSKANGAAARREAKRLTAPLGYRTRAKQRMKHAAAQARSRRAVRRTRRKR